MVERGDLENLKPPIDADARGCMSVPSACIGGSYLRGTRRAGYLLVTAWTQDVPSQVILMLYATASDSKAVA